MILRKIATQCLRLIKLQLVFPSISFVSHIGPTLNLNDPPLFEAMSNSPKSKELRNKIMPFSFKWSILVCVFQVRGFYVYVLEDFPCRFWWTRIHFPLKCKGFAILSPQHLFVPDVVGFDLQLSSSEGLKLPLCNCQKKCRISQFWLGST